MSQVHRLDVELFQSGYDTVIIDMTSNSFKVRYFRVDENKNVYGHLIEIIERESKEIGN